MPTKSSLVLALSSGVLLAPVAGFSILGSFKKQPSSLRSTISDSTGRDATNTLDKLPGDYGFDPLNLGDKDLHLFSATDRAMQILRQEVFVDRAPELVMRDYRDAELRHGRLAMIAALAWPVQEICGPYLSRYFNSEGISGLADVLVVTAGRSPSVLNGGLGGGIVPYFLLGAAALVGSIDIRSLDIRDQKQDDFVPGDFGFDPLCFSKGMTAEEKFKMGEREINNGRLAMVAVTIYVIEEFITKAPLTELTPWLFNPAFAFPEVRGFLDDAFDVASAAQRISGDEVARFVDQIPK